MKNRVAGGRPRPGRRPARRGAVGHVGVLLRAELILQPPQCAQHVLGRFPHIRCRTRLRSAAAWRGGVRGGNRPSRSAGAVARPLRSLRKRRPYARGQHVQRCPPRRCRQAPSPAVVKGCSQRRVGSESSARSMRLRARSRSAPGARQRRSVRALLLGEPRGVGCSPPSCTSRSRAARARAASPWRPGARAPASAAADA